MGLFKDLFVWRNHMDKVFKGVDYAIKFLNCNVEVYIHINRDYLNELQPKLFYYINNYKWSGVKFHISIEEPCYIGGEASALMNIIETGTADGVDSEISSGRPLLGIVGVGVEADHYYYLAEDEGRIYPLTEDEAKATDGAFYATHTGVLITGVTEGMDAAGKIEKNDIIIAVDGIRTESIAAMSAILNDKDIGDEVDIEYIRDKESYTVKVRLSSVK